MLEMKYLEYIEIYWKFPFGYNKEIENTKVSLCLHYNVY